MAGCNSTHRSNMRPIFPIVLALQLLSFCGAGFEMSISSGNEYFTRVLEDLLSNPLTEDKILLVLDPKLLEHADIDDVFVKALSQAESYCVVTWDTPISETGIPRAVIRGSYVTTIVLFENDHRPFFDKEAVSWLWNPDYIILFNLNRDLDTRVIAQHPLVQRSKYIVTFNPGAQKNDSYSLHRVHPSIYQRQDNNFFWYRAAGFWNKTRFPNKKDLFKWSGSNFGGAIIELASFCDDFPFLYQNLTFDAIKTSSECVGAGLEILDIMAAKFNFSYVVQMIPPDQNWGAMENGSWIWTIF